MVRRAGASGIRPVRIGPLRIGRARRTVRPANAGTDAVDEAAGKCLVTFIVPIAVAAVLLLHASGAFASAGVGGAVTIGLVLLAATPAVAIHEAWTRKRGVLGWIVNIVVAFAGALAVAPIGGLVVAVALAPFADASSLAASGGAVMSVALAAMTIVTLLGSWLALSIVNRWR